MKIPVLLLLILVVCGTATLPPAAFADAPSAKTVDWLVNPAPFKAQITQDQATHELVLDNDLARRVFQLMPNAACVSLENLTSQEHLLRAIAPEARLTLNGIPYAIGGLTGAPSTNNTDTAWRDKLTPIPNSYQFTGWKEEEIKPRFGWKKRPEWMARDLPWPPPGKHIVMTYAPPAQAKAADLPTVEVHYELYDGIPLLSKWLVVKNDGKNSVRVNRFTAEELHMTQAQSAPHPDDSVNLHVETDYSFGSMKCRNANQAVKWTVEPAAATAVNAKSETSVMLSVAPPEMGPDVDVAPGTTFESFRVFDLLLDSSDRERRTLAQRHLYRTVAPWTTENPFMFHKTKADPKDIRQAIDQAAAVGFDMVIMSFGSGFNFESRDAKYQAQYKELADYGKSRGVTLGGYSLLASRSASNKADNTQGSKAKFGVMPCLGAQWGHDYLAQMQNMCANTGFGVFENDGSYPGDRCAATDHPFHHGLEDSQWVQWRAITGLYQWCTANGVYLNIPDYYYLAGGTKCGMGYIEKDWSKPRAQQEIIERQDMFDGTWEKTGSMGWMHVPLTQYHGGGAAATYEPLKDHLADYEVRLANLVGYGVQACYRGARLYDTDETKALVKKWVSFYKTHHEVLDGDIIHLRRADQKDWDGIVHVNPQGREKAMAFFYNPLPEEITRAIPVPLHYAGLTGKVQVSIGGTPAQIMELDKTQTVTVQVTIPAHGHQWVLFTE